VGCFIVGLGSRIDFRFVIGLQRCGAFTTFLRTFMRQRFRIFFSLFWFVWTTVLVPAHTRGMIQLVKEDCCAVREVKSCCQRCTPGKGDSSKPVDRQNCAVCDLVSHFTAPPVFDFDLEPSGIVQILPVTIPQSLVAQATGLPFHSRGPPLV